MQQAWPDRLTVQQQSQQQQQNQHLLLLQFPLVGCQLTMCLMLCTSLAATHSTCQSIASLGLREWALCTLRAVNRLPLDAVTSCMLHGKCVLVAGGGNTMNGLSIQTHFVCFGHYLLVWLSVACW
jgi:hypothetical protein